MSSRKPRGGGGGGARTSYRNLRATKQHEPGHKEWRPWPKGLPEPPPEAVATPAPMLFHRTSGRPRSAQPSSRPRSPAHRPRPASGGRSRAPPSPSPPPPARGGDVVEMNLAGGVVYRGQVQDGQRHGKGIMRWPDGSQYVGEFAANEVQGKGSKTWADGRTYTGMWSKGWMHGQGTMTWQDTGESYTGGFRTGFFSGTGVHTMGNGDTYSGEFRSGQRHGRGTFVAASGWKYEGEWIEGRMSGVGKESWGATPGLQFRGQFLGGRREGFGRIHWGKAEYEGEVQDGHPNGYGSKTFASGSKYTGTFLQGVPHSLGAATVGGGSPSPARARPAGGSPDTGRSVDHRSPAGPRDSPAPRSLEKSFRTPSKHTPTAKNAARSGTGSPHSAPPVRCSLEYRDGSAFEGTFREGVPAPGPGTRSYADGTVLKGHFVHPEDDDAADEGGKGVGMARLAAPGGEATVRLEAQGRGSKRWASGAVYQGELQRSQPHGEGRFSWPDGRVYEGEFRDGEMTGSGTLTWLDSRRRQCSYRGEFENGLLHGHGEMWAGDGGHYKGRFQMGKYNGNGRYTWLGRGGSVVCEYEGEWLGGKIDGAGRLEWPNGDFKEGLFASGEFVSGNGQFTWPNGDVYRGQWARGEMNGVGLYCWDDGTIYNGAITGGRPKGLGKKVWPDGSFYVGELRDGEAWGVGVFTDGRDVRKGRWEDGELVDEATGTVDDFLNVYPKTALAARFVRAGITKGPAEERAEAASARQKRGVPRGSGYIMFASGLVMDD